MEGGNATPGNNANAFSAELKLELAALFEFCRNNPAAIAAGVVFLTGCAILSYSLTTDAAVNVFSTDLIAAIPVVFSSLVVLSLLSLLFTAAPTIVLFERAYKDRHGKLHLLLQPQNFDRGHRRRVRGKVQRISIARLAVFANPGLVLALWALAETLLDGIFDTRWYLLSLAFLIAVTSSTYLAGKLRRPQRHRSMAADQSTRWLSSLLQTVLMMLVLLLTLKSTTGIGLKDGQIIAAILLAPIVTASFQIVLVMIVARLSGNRGFIRRLFYATLAFIAIFCMLPPTSSLLLKRHFMDSATAYGSCFRLAVDANAPMPQGLIDTQFKSNDGQVWSKQMVAVAPIEDWVQVRLKIDNGILYRVSKQSFSQTIACNSEGKLSSAK